MGILVKVSVSLSIAIMLSLKFHQTHHNRTHLMIALKFIWFQLISNIHFAIRKIVLCLTAAVATRSSTVVLKVEFYNKNTKHQCFYQMQSYCKKFSFKVNLINFHNLIRFFRITSNFFAVSFYLFIAGSFHDKTKQTLFVFIL